MTDVLDNKIWEVVHVNFYNETRSLGLFKSKEEATRKMVSAYQGEGCVTTIKQRELI